jgi:hypothetical protein
MFPRFGWDSVLHGLASTQIGANRKSKQAYRWKKENFNLKIDSDLFLLVPTLNTAASRRS